MTISALNKPSNSSQNTQNQVLNSVFINSHNNDLQKYTIHIYKAYSKIKFYGQ